jgi:hypothetical protein
MKKLLTLVASLIIAINATGQIPQGFNYQTVIRNNDGQPLAEQMVGIRISLQNESGLTVHYSESHTPTTSAQGAVSITIGGGTIVSGTFANIPWSEGNIHIKVEVDPLGGTSYAEMGTTKLQTVPYALHAQSATQIVNPNGGGDEPLFVVRNNADLIVFAVYETGIRMYVDDAPSGDKSDKAGFAIGGLTGQKGLDDVKEYFRITPDSVRIYMREPVGKTNKAGFAIGGLTGPKTLPDEYLRVTRGSTRISIDPDAVDKTNKAGFAIGGLTGPKKLNEEFLRVTRDSTRVYVNTDAKSNKGGFAIGGLTGVKADSINFMFLTPENYFIGHKAGMNTTPGAGTSSIGKYNSFIGYESGKTNVIGNYNTFMGYQAGLKNTGSDNTFIGYLAGRNHMSTGGNVYIGSKAGRASTSGEQNVYIGEYAGDSTSTGKQNIFLGVKSGVRNRTGNQNIFIGVETGHDNNNGLRNIFLGNRSGYKNINGEDNIYLGYEAGYKATNGQNNIFLGNNAGYNNQGSSSFEGNFNIFMGYYSGEKNTIGQSNVFIGDLSGVNNTEGRYNVYIGKNAGGGGTSNFNVALGAQAKVTGNGNVSIGNMAGNGSTGQASILIGNRAGENQTDDGVLIIQNSEDMVTPLIHGFFYEDRIAFHRTATTYPLQVGNSFTNGNQAYLTAGGVWTNASSRAKKDRFKEIDGEEVLQKISSMEIKGWFFRGTQEYHIGPFAEDFHKAFGTGCLDIKEDLGRFLSASDVAGVGFVAVQQLIEKVNSLEKENADLKARLDRIEQLLQKD